jgi:hypothetical protein
VVERRVESAQVEQVSLSTTIFSRDRTKSLSHNEVTSTCSVMFVHGSVIHDWI